MEAGVDGGDFIVEMEEAEDLPLRKTSAEIFEDKDNEEDEDLNNCDIEEEEVE